MSLSSRSRERDQHRNHVEESRPIRSDHLLNHGEESSSKESDQHRNHGEESSSKERDQHRNHGEESRLIDTETIAFLRKQHQTPTAFAANLMLELFTMDEMTVKNVNLEGLKAKRTQGPAVALSPTRVMELKRHCLQNIPLNERKSVWKSCRKACNQKLYLLKRFKKKRSKQQN